MLIIEQLAYTVGGSCCSAFQSFNSGAVLLPESFRGGCSVGAFPDDPRRSLPRILLIVFLFRFAGLGSVSFLKLVGALLGRVRCQAVLALRASTSRLRAKPRKAIEEPIGMRLPERAACRRREQLVPVFAERVQKLIFGIPAGQSIGLLPTV